VAPFHDDLPERRWELSAPESLVLLWGPETGDAWAVKVALLELIVRRVLRLATAEDRRFFLFSSYPHILAPGIRLDPSAGRPLRMPIEVYPKPRTYADGTFGVPVETLAQAVFTRNWRRVRTRPWSVKLDRSGGGYVQAKVLPALLDRGLFERDRSTHLGLITTSRWVLTAAGSTALADLRALMETGRRSFPAWLDHDPARARTYVERARAALLLLGGWEPLLARFRQGRPDGGDTGWRSTGPPSVDDRGFARADRNWDTDPFTLDALAGCFGPGPLDTIDVAFHTISAGVDRAWDALHRRGGFLLAGGE
jgi:hypothetical protein